MALKIMKRLMGKPQKGSRAEEKLQKRKEKFQSSRWQRESEEPCLFIAVSPAEVGETKVGDS